MFKSVGPSFPTVGTLSYSNGCVISNKANPKIKEGMLIGAKSTVIEVINDYVFMVDSVLSGSGVSCHYASLGDVPANEDFINYIEGPVVPPAMIFGDVIGGTYDGSTLMCRSIQGATLTHVAADEFISGCLVTVQVDCREAFLSDLTGVTIGSGHFQYCRGVAGDYCDGSFFAGKKLPFPLRTLDGVVIDTVYQGIPEYSYVTSTTKQDGKVFSVNSTVPTGDTWERMEAIYGGANGGDYWYKSTLKRASFENCIVKSEGDIDSCVFVNTKVIIHDFINISKCEFVNSELVIDASSATHVGKVNVLNNHFDRSKITVKPTANISTTTSIVNIGNNIFANCMDSISTEDGFRFWSFAFRNYFTNSNRPAAMFFEDNKFSHEQMVGVPAYATFSIEGYSVGKKVAADYSSAKMISVGTRIDWSTPNMKVEISGMILKFADYVPDVVSGDTVITSLGNIILKERISGRRFIVNYPDTSNLDVMAVERTVQNGLVTAEDDTLYILTWHQGMGMPMSNATFVKADTSRRYSSPLLRFREFAVTSANGGTFDGVTMESESTLYTNVALAKNCIVSEKFSFADSSCVFKNQVDSDGSLIEQRHFESLSCKYYKGVKNRSITLCIADNRHTSYRASSYSGRVMETTEMAHDMGPSPSGMYTIIDGVNYYAEKTFEKNGFKAILFDKKIKAGTSIVDPFMFHAITTSEFGEIMAGADLSFSKSRIKITNCQAPYADLSSVATDYSNQISFEICGVTQNTKLPPFTSFDRVRLQPGVDVGNYATVLRSEINGGHFPKSTVKACEIYSDMTGVPNVMGSTTSYNPSSLGNHYGCKLAGQPSFDFVPEVDGYPDYSCGLGSVDYVYATPTGGGEEDRVEELEVIGDLNFTVPNVMIRGNRFNMNFPIDGPVRYIVGMNYVSNMPLTVDNGEKFIIRNSVFSEGVINNGGSLELINCVFDGIDRIAAVSHNGGTTRIANCTFKDGYSGPTGNAAGMRCTNVLSFGNYLADFAGSIEAINCASGDASSFGLKGDGHFGMFSPEVGGPWFDPVYLKCLPILGAARVSPSGHSAYSDELSFNKRGSDRWDIGASETTEYFASNVPVEMAYVDAEGNTDTVITTEFETKDVYIYNNAHPIKRYENEFNSMAAANVFFSENSSCNFNIYFEQDESFEGIFNITDSDSRYLSNIKISSDIIYKGVVPSKHAKVKFLIGSYVPVVENMLVERLDIDGVQVINKGVMTSCVIRSFQDADKFINNTFKTPVQVTDSFINNLFVGEVYDIDSNRNKGCDISEVEADEFTPKLTSTGIINSGRGGVYVDPYFGVMEYALDKSRITRMYGSYIDIGAVESSLIEQSFDASDMTRIFQDILTKKGDIVTGEDGYEYLNNGWNIDEAKAVIELRTSKPNILFSSDRKFDVVCTLNAFSDGKRVVIDQEYNETFRSVVSRFASGRYVFNMKNNKLTVYKNPVSKAQVNKNAGGGLSRIV